MGTYERENFKKLLLSHFSTNFSYFMKKRGVLAITCDDLPNITNFMAL